VWANYEEKDMGNNVTFLGDIADFLSGIGDSYLEWRDNTLRRVAGPLYPWIGPESRLPIGFLLARQTDGVQLIQSFIDTLRIGNGFRDGIRDASVTGMLQDELRVLSLVGPALRAVGTASRVITVGQRENTMVCSWFTHRNALRRTLQSPFVTVSEWMTEAGYVHNPSAINVPGATVGVFEPGVVGAHGNTYPAGVSRLLDALRRRNIPVHDFFVASDDFNQLVNIASSNRRSVITVGLEVTRNKATFGHHFMTVFNPTTGVEIVDPYGRVFRGMSELLSTYQSVRIARAYPVAIIDNSALVNIVESGRARPWEIAFAVTPICRAAERAHINGETRF
jgi:hypothetical protein